MKKDLLNIFGPGNSTKLNKAKYTKNIVTKCIYKGNYATAKIKLDEYESMIPWDIDISTIKSVIYMKESNLELARDTLLEAIKILPYNFDINYNLGYIYEIQNEHDKAYKYYLRAAQVAQGIDERNEIDEAISNLLRTYPYLDESELRRVNNKLFPLRTKSDTWIGKSMLTDNRNKGYISLYYDECILDFPINLWNFYKTEILYGEVCKDNIFINNLGIGEKALPIATLKQGTSITIIKNGEKLNLNNLNPNKYYYIPIRENTEHIEINGNDSFIVGDLIELKKNKKNKIKLNLNIFIDGLAQKIFDEIELSDLMPNTFRFFSKGTIFNNCFSNAEWTFPSIASINMGTYLHKHHLFHPEIIYDVNERGKILPLFFKENGYLTFQACGNWRKTPSYGYVNGYDRTIYQSATIGGEADDMIFDFLEHMRAFEDRDNAIWLTFFELHKTQDSITPKISNQLKNGVLVETNIEGKVKSVDLSYDLIKTRNYINEIKRLDYYLNIIYEFIEKNYHDDEMVISLFSDHGVSFIDNEKFMLRDARTKIPFMIRGRDIPQILSSELIEGVDILPSILSKSGIEYDENCIDGRIPRTLGGKGKDYVISESIYPGKTYKAAIRDENYYFTFESDGLVDSDGRFTLGNYIVNLYDKVNLADVTKEYIDKTSLFTEIILDNIKYFIKI